MTGDESVVNDSPPPLLTMKTMDSWFFRVTLSFLRPLLLGFGTIFQPKAEAADHWSNDPRISIQVEVSGKETGNPFENDDEDTVLSKIDRHSGTVGDRPSIAVGVIPGGALPYA